MAERLRRYGSHPICPRCGWDQFDDWWHVLKVKFLGATPHGHLNCDCGRFRIDGQPGNIISSCYGVERHA
jgi:hypothetical protein